MTKSVLFVCAANICRSPALHATLKHLAAQKGISDLKVDSCGIGWFHVGEHPDSRTFEAAKKRGIVIDHRSQQFQTSFFDEFDLILAVEPKIVDQIRLRVQTPKQLEKVHLATDFSTKYKGQPIQDPYYLSEPDFDKMMDLIVDLCTEILKKI